MDPAGTWAKFLSTANSSATKEDVEIFLGHLMKFMGTLIHASDVSHKRAMEQLKRAAEGKD
jgi:tRNA C32,U32 (ribose-2'-O)-methylase TrmJ